MSCPDPLHDYEDWKNQYDKQTESVKRIEPCATTKKRKTPYGAAKRNYYGELRKFRGYRGPINNT